MTTKSTISIANPLCKDSRTMWFNISISDKIGIGQSKNDNFMIPGLFLQPPVMILSVFCILNLCVGVVLVLWSDHTVSAQKLLEIDGNTKGRGGSCDN